MLINNIIVRIIIVIILVAGLETGTLALCPLNRANGGIGGFGGGDALHFL